MERTGVEPVTSALQIHRAVGPTAMATVPTRNLDCKLCIHCGGIRGPFACCAVYTALRVEHLRCAATTSWLHSAQGDLPIEWLDTHARARLPTDGSPQVGRPYAWAMSLPDENEAPRQLDGSPASRGALSARQERAILALLNHPSISKAARAAAVGERTLRRWLAEQPFGQAYRNARRDAFTHALSLAQRYAPRAASTLAKVMSDANAGASSRVAAAVALLRFSRDSIELDDLAARVEALEHAADKTNPPHSRLR